MNNLQVTEAQRVKARQFLSLMRKRIAGKRKDIHRRDKRQVKQVELNEEITTNF